MTKKIRVLVPYFILEIIEHDIEKFNIKKNRLANIIFNHFKDGYREFLGDDEIKNNIIQFNLNKNNDEIYSAIMSTLFTKRIDTEAKLFRSIFYTYISNPSSIREKIIFSESYKLIEESIDNRVQIKVKYNGSFRVVEPLFLSDTKERLTNYLCGYSYKYDNIINYKLTKIEKVVPLRLEQKKRDNFDIVNLKKNFDPYLSYNKKVVIKLSKKGIKLFENSVFKPKVISKEKNIYTIEASEYRAMEFLASFWSDVEVIEPISLRDKIEKKIKELVELYNL